MSPPSNTMSVLRIFHLRIAHIRTFKQSSPPRSSLPPSPRLSILTQQIHTTAPSTRKHNPPVPATQPTDSSKIFSTLDVLSSAPRPSSSIETIYQDGFLLSNGLSMHTSTSELHGLILLNNEAFRWKPINLKDTEEKNKAYELLKKGVLELSDDCWGILDVVWPKPDLLIVGTGAKILLLHPKSKKRLRSMGISVDVMDTRNAAAEYNLLATERPNGQVAATLMVAGFGNKI